MTRLVRYLAALSLVIAMIGGFAGSAHATHPGTFTGQATIEFPNSGTGPFTLNATAMLSGSGTSITRVQFASDVAGVPGSFVIDTGSPGWSRTASFSNYAMFALLAPSDLTVAQINCPPDFLFCNMNVNSKLRTTLFNGQHNVYLQGEGTAGSLNFKITFIGSE